MDDLLQEMIDPTPEPGDRPRRRRLVATIAIVGLAVVGVTSLTTGALFTDREQTDDGFTTGTVDLSLTAPVNFHVIGSGLIPGDSYHSAVQVNNAGSLALRYAVTYTAEREDPTTVADSSLPGGPMAAADGFPADAGVAPRDDLRDYVKLDVWSVPDEGACSDTPGTGAQLLATTPTLSKTALTPLIGSKETGFQDASNGANNADRALASHTNEWLCFVVTMDLEAGNTLQNTGANLTFDFFAEQTAHNS